MLLRKAFLVSTRHHRSDRLHLPLPVAAAHSGDEARDDALKEKHRSLFQKAKALADAGVMVYKFSREKMKTVKGSKQTAGVKASQALTAEEFNEVKSDLEKPLDQTGKPQRNGQTRESPNLRRPRSRNA